MILGRPADLVAAAVTALLNVIFLVAGSAGYAITPEIVAGVNIAAGAIIAVLAFQPPTLNAGSQVNVTTPSGQPNASATVGVTPGGDVTVKQS